MTSLSDILFPSQEASLAAASHNSSSINRILGDLKRSNLSITNRLRSIQQDATFVEEVRSAFGGGGSRKGEEGEERRRRRQHPLKRPLVANERCGSWYIRPEAKGGSSYFKSTDGHTGQWKFSTRRLNLHLLPIIERFDGIIIVDSTRRGKRMPDALSKTIPIWCCVLNRALFPDQPALHDLYVPPNAVSASERSQMLARIPEGLEALRQLKLDVDGLRAQVSKPLRPTWVTQETDLSHYYYDYHYNNYEADDDDDDDDRGQDGKEGAQADDSSSSSSSARVRIFDDFRPVICCTASKRVTGGEMSGHTGYIQGAGDDTENWAHGLTPHVFWAHADELLSAPETVLPDKIRRLLAVVAAAASDQSTAATAVAESVAAAGDSHLYQQDLPPTVRRLTPYLYVSPLPIPFSIHDRDQDNSNKNDTTTSLPSSSSSPWCRISLLPTVTPPETWVQSPTQLNVGLGKHKVASRNLRVALVNICDFVTRYLHSDSCPSEQEEEEEGDAKNEQESPPPPPPPPQQQKRILIACETGGRDLSIGVALALLCWCFADDEGKVPLAAAAAAAAATPKSEGIATGPTAITTSHKRNNNDDGDGDGNNANHNDDEKTNTSPPSASSSSLPPPLPAQPAQPMPSFNKTMIKIRLGRIMTAMPDANPNRATLQSVNSFLMDWRK